MLTARNVWQRIEEACPEENMWRLTREVRNGFLPNELPPDNYLPTEMIEMNLRIIRAIKEKFFPTKQHLYCEVKSENGLAKDSSNLKNNLD